MNGYRWLMDGFFIDSVLSSTLGNFFSYDYLTKENRLQKTDGPFSLYYFDAVLGWEFLWPDFIFC